MLRSLLAFGVLVSLAFPSWAGEKKNAPKKVPSGTIKVEIRGTLRVVDKVEVVSATLGQLLAKQPVNATALASGITMPLLFSNRELANLAKEHDGQAVVITGELHRAYEGPVSGLDPQQFDDYIHVTGLTAAKER